MDGVFFHSIFHAYLYDPLSLRIIDSGIIVGDTQDRDQMWVERVFDPSLLLPLTIHASV